MYEQSGESIPDRFSYYTQSVHPRDQILGTI